MSKICLSLNKDKLFVIFLQGVCFITPYYTNSSICVWAQPLELKNMVDPTNIAFVLWEKKYFSEIN